jgi:hypothetical protein
MVRPEWRSSSATGNIVGRALKGNYPHGDIGQLDGKTYWT